MHVLVLVAIAVFVVAIVAGLAVVGLRALALWRAARTFQKRLTAEIDAATARAAEIEQRLAAPASGAGELETASRRLQQSLGDLLILARAFSGAWAVVGRARAVLPSK